MPEVLPTRLIFQQFQKKFATMMLTVSRAILVSFIWLIILPYFTVWIWRMYFFLGHHVSKRLVKLQEMKHQLSSTNTTLFFDTIPNNNNITLNWLEEYKSRFTMQ